ncbi:MAG: BON domain-containing protein [Candidatus Competibacteraceae bacterium]
MITLSSRAQPLILASILVLTGCNTLFGGDVVKEEPPQDAAIATKVKAKLIEERVGAAAIRVESDQGIVKLSGFVDSEQQRQRATTLARSVPGVKSVNNTIEVK